MKGTKMHTELRFGNIVGESKGLRRVLDPVETVAPADSRGYRDC
jgi:transcriptional regulator with GAF, ATPase, and Fis domain